MTNLPIIGSFKVTATYGQKGSAWKDGHKGIDIVCNDKNIYATCDGTVRVVAYDANGWGQYVSIGDADGNRHIFCHLVKGSVKVTKGQKVNRNTIIGTMGSSGNSSGVHLHYQLNDKNNTPKNPCSYLGVPNAKGTYNSDDYAIDKNKKEEVKNNTSTNTNNQVKDDDYMTGEQIYKELMNYLDKLPTSDWAKTASKAGIKSGAFSDANGDGYVDNPRSFVTREQLAQVLYNKGFTK